MSVISETFAWQLLAACRTEDRGLFFGPESEAWHEKEAREAEAVKVCAGCIAREDCLAAAVTSNIKHGVWGGLGEDERRLYRYNLRRRGLAAEAREA